MTITCTRYIVTYKNGDTDTIPAVVWTSHYMIHRGNIESYEKEEYKVKI